MQIFEKSQSHSTDGFLQSVRVQGATLKNSFRFRGALATPKFQKGSTPKLSQLPRDFGDSGTLWLRFDLAHFISQSINIYIYIYIGHPPRNYPERGGPLIL